MLKLFKTLIILYSTVATVSAANIQFGEDYPFNPLKYPDDGDGYDIIVPLNESDGKNTPSYSGSTASGYIIGQLVKVTTSGEITNIQACVDKDNNNIKWYDLATYIANYLVENTHTGSNIHINQDINFIVKDNYTIKNEITMSKTKLFIPETITLTIPFNFSCTNIFISNVNCNFLIFGTIEENRSSNYNAIFKCSVGSANLVMGPNCKINIPYTSDNRLVDGNNVFFSNIIYPEAKLNNEILSCNADNYETIYGETYASYGVDTSGVSSIAKLKNDSKTIDNNCILYLNRFLDPNETGISDKEKNTRIKDALQLKAQLASINIVLPSFLKYKDPLFIKKYIGIEPNSEKPFYYIDLFPNLLFIGDNPPYYGGTKIPTNSTEAQIGEGKHRYFFEPVYGTKNLYDDNITATVDFVEQSDGKKVLSLIIPESANPSQTITNPFSEYDTAFYNGYNPVINEINKPEYDIYNADYSNPTTNKENKYWDTATIDDLFVDNDGNPYKLSQNIPAELNVGLIGDENVTTTQEEVQSNGYAITLNGNDQDYNGTYTVPSNTTTVNLNHENALVNISKANTQKREIIYKDVKEDPPSESSYETQFYNFEIDDLRNLTYNIGTDINWDVSKTENLLYNNTNEKRIVLDMQLVGSDKVITFTNSNNDLVVDTITFNRPNSASANNLKYFIPSSGMNTVIFESPSSIVKIQSNLNLIFTSSDTIFLSQTSLMGALLKKVKYGTNENIKTIILYDNDCTTKDTYTYENTPNRWKKNSELANVETTSLVASRFFCTVGDIEEKDNRDTVNEMRDPGYTYNNENAVEHFYLNTTRNGYYNEIIGNTDEDKTKYDINQLYNGAPETNDEKNTENFSNNMPPILNIGLVNNGDLTIENSSSDNTKVEINGINYGIRDCYSMNLLCWPDYNNSYDNGYTQEINNGTISNVTANNIPYTSTIIGKPYTGELTVPNEITDVEFDYFSFIPDIKRFNNSTNDGTTSAFTGNYTFKGYNVVQYYNTDGNIEVKSGSKILLPSYDENENKENVDYYDYPTQEEKLNLTLNKVTVNAGAKVILNNAHISIKAPQ